MDDQKHAKVYDFLRRHKLAVIATNSSGSPTPESALIAYVEDAGLHIYFQTGQHSRKARNLAHDAHASFVIGHNADELATVQYEGLAELLADEDDIAICKQRFIDKDSPTTSEHLKRPDAVFYRVTRTWIRFADYSSSAHPVVFVLDEFDNVGDVTIAAGAGR